MDVYVDVFPARAEDLSVWISSSRVHIDLECDETTWRGVVRPPSGMQSFADDGRARLHNGVLRVTVGVLARRPSCEHN